jgi:hypothetical protein
LQIRVKAAAGAVIRVGNVITELRAFAANFASFSHDYSVPPSIKSRMRIVSVKNHRIRAIDSKREFIANGLPKRQAGRADIPCEPLVIIVNFEGAESVQIN